MGFFFWFFWPHHTACGILVPRPGIEPVPLAVEAQSPNHWTAREFPIELLLVSKFYLSFNPHNKLYGRYYLPMRKLRHRGILNLMEEGTESRNASLKITTLIIPY